MTHVAQGGEKARLSGLGQPRSRRAVFFKEEMKLDRCAGSLL